MSNEVKAQILVDTTGAMQNIQELTKESSDASASLSKIAKEITKWQIAVLKSSADTKEHAEATKKLETYQKDYINALKRDIEVMKIFGATDTDIAKKINEITKAEEVFAKSGNQKFMKHLEEQADSLRDLERELQAYANQLESAKQLRFEAIQAEADRKDQIELERQIAAERQVQYDVATLLGDQQKILNMQLEVANAALEEAVRNFGAMSTEAQQAAANVQDIQAALSGVSGGGILSGTNLFSIFANIVKFQLLLRPVTKAFNFLRDTIKQSKESAAEAEQTYSKLATVFDTVAVSADRMASSLATSIGVAKSTAASALSTVGDLLQAQGMGTSESLSTASAWVSQFQDIIAFKDINMSLEEFAQNFMSGAAGNLRNFRTFGSIVKESAVNARLAAEGLDKLTGSQLELAKMTTRANMALEQQENAIGATEREWDTTLSVNRRLSEAWKETTENIGENINKVMRPLKTWWTDVLTEMNKAVKAQKEYAAGQRDIKVYDTENNAADKATFRTALRSSAIDALKYNVYNEDLDSTYQKQLNDVDRTLVEFGVSVDSFVKYLKEWGYETKFSEKTLELLIQKEKERNEILAKEAAIAERSTKIENLVDSYDSFAEALLGIRGVNFKASNFSTSAKRYSGSDADTEFATNVIAKTIFRNVSAALESVTGPDTVQELSEIWGDVISGALDELNEGDLRQAQIDALRSVFETTWNEFAEGGFDENEVEILNKIKVKYGELTAGLDDYNKELERQKLILDGINAMEAHAMDYARQLAQLGMDSDEIALDDLRREYEELLAKALPEEIDDLNAAYDNAEQSLTLLLRKQKEYNEQLEKEAARKAAITSAKSTLDDYSTQLRNYGLSEYEITYNDLLNKKKNAQSGAEANLYSDSLRAFRTLTAKQIVDSFSGMAYASEEATLGMSENEKQLYLLEQEYLAASKSQALNAKDLKLLENNYKAQRTALENLQKKMDEIEREQTAKSIVEQFSADAYAADMATLRMSDTEKQLYQLEQAFNRAKQAKELNADDLKQLTSNYEAQKKALKALQAAQAVYNAQLEREAKIKNIQNGNDYQTQLANYGLSDFDVEYEILRVERDAAIAKHDPMWAYYQKEMDALEELRKRTLEAAEAMQWNAIANRALGAMGTTGNVINAFRGEGDIWSKIINAILTILESTESWGEISQMLDKLFAMFEPVVESIMDLIAALPWEDIIIFFKIVATVLVVVTKIMEGITKLFNWIWENIKTAFYNLGVVIHNAFSLNDWEKREYKNIGELIKDIRKTIETGAQRVEDIWNTDVQIERNTRAGDDYAKQIAVVKNLYDAGVLTATEYRAQLNKITGGSPFDVIRSYGPGTYQAGNGGVNYYTGDRILNITIPNYKGDVSELAREIVRQQKLMNEPGGNTAA